MRLYGALIAYTQKVHNTVYAFEVQSRQKEWNNWFSWMIEGEKRTVGVMFNRWSREKRKICPSFPPNTIKNGRASGNPNNTIYLTPHVYFIKQTLIKLFRCIVKCSEWLFFVWQCLARNVYYWARDQDTGTDQAWMVHYGVRNFAAIQKRWTTSTRIRKQVA